MSPTSTSGGLGSGSVGFSGEVHVTETQVFSLSSPVVRCTDNGLVSYPKMNELIVLCKSLILGWQR